MADLLDRQHAETVETLLNVSAEWVRVMESGEVSEPGAEVWRVLQIAEGGLNVVELGVGKGGAGLNGGVHGGWLWVEVGLLVGGCEIAQPCGERGGPDRDMRS